MLSKKGDRRGPNGSLHVVILGRKGKTGERGIGKKGGLREGLKGKEVERLF